MNSASNGSGEKFRGTRLWVRIEENAPLRLTSWMGTIMPDIELVLAKAGTAPVDFTLHDDDHAVRVAEWIPEIIPPDVFALLSPEELCLLLLAAYVHDVGMSPERRTVNELRQFLLSGEPGSLTAREREEFQQWLDAEPGGIVPPMIAGTPTGEELAQAELFVAHYLRHLHNDASATFVKRELKRHGEPYPSFLADLLLIAQSHHYDRDQLVEKRFDPRSLPGGAWVHLRYLACVLRIADILENDPDRTPKVLARHRDIVPSSRIYWEKDHSFNLRITDNQVCLYGRPATARTHRAIETTADAIEHELRLCHEIKLDHDFEKYRVHKLPHRWDLRETLHRDLAPHGDCYEYIDGSFRPDATRLLELLGGTALYGTPLAAVRELLQNAFDAVKERLARERLAQRDPSDEEPGRRRAQELRVELRWEEDEEGRAWLVCTDDGVGMTKTIIRDYLLVSGRSTRPELMSLERRCERAGFQFVRTGQFGIGFLSYFMLADRVIVTTRRAEICKDTDGGWRFETDGIGSFGELRRAPDAPVGTEVRLRLAQSSLPRLKFTRDIVEEAESKSAFSGIKLPAPEDSPQHTVAFYVLTKVAWIPCRFRLKCAGIDWWIPPHWTRASELCRLQVWRQIQLAMLIKAGEQFVLPPGAEECLKLATSTIRILEVEQDLPNKLGRVRILVPWFDLPGGASLFFFWSTPDRDELRLIRPSEDESFHREPVFFVRPRLWRTESWRGFHIKSARAPSTLDRILKESHNGQAVDVEWWGHALGAPQINREDFNFANEENYWDIHSEIEDRTRQILACFAEANRGSRFAALNFRLAGLPVPADVPLRWLEIDKNAVTARWQDVRFPLSARLFRPWADSGASSPSDIQEISLWEPDECAPERVLIAPPHEDTFDDWSLIGYWDTNPRPGRPESTGFVTRMPTGWEQLIGHSHTFERREYGAIAEYRRRIWNRDNALVRFCGEAGAAWAGESWESALNAPPGGDWLQRPERIAARILAILQNEMWTDNTERDATLLDLYRRWLALTANSHTSPPTMFFWYCYHAFRRDKPSPILVEITPQQIIRHTGNALLKRFLPLPPEEWRIRI